MHQILHNKQRARKFTNFADFDQFIHLRHSESDRVGLFNLMLGDVRRMTIYFDRLEHQLKRIARTRDSLFVEHRRGIDLSNDGQFLWTVLRDAEAEASALMCEGRRLNPWLTLGLHLARKWGPRLRPHAFINPNRLDVNHPYSRRTMAHVAYVIRRVCSSRKFRSLVNNDTRNAKENYLSCANLMIDVLKEDARILVLRLDLYFEGDARILSESEAAKTAYDKFLRNLREGEIVPDVLAYIGKREMGLEKRIHYHVLVALDGDEHRNAFQLTEQLVRFWVHDCVGGSSLASAFNCWPRRHELEYNCMGLLHYSDSRMLMGLRLALEYLCKEGAHILVSEHMGRNLRKSIRPKARVDASRRGAPRKHGNDVHVAQQVLLTDVKLDRTWGVERAYPSQKLS